MTEKMSEDEIPLAGDIMGEVMKGVLEVEEITCHHVVLEILYFVSRQHWGKTKANLLGLQASGK